MPGIVFLLEDTLVPDQTVERWQWAWRPQGPILSVRTVRAVLKRQLHAWDRRRWAGFAGAAAPVGEAEQTQFLRETLFALAGRPLPEEETEAVVRRFRRASVQPPWPEVIPALERLRAAGWEISAVSERPGPDGPEMAKRAGLLPYLGRFLGAEPEAPWLPSKEAFRAHARALGQKPAELTFVGRLYWSDLRAANRIGFQGILLDRSEWWPRISERRHRSLAELVEGLLAPAPAAVSAPAAPPASPGSPTAGTP